MMCGECKHYLDCGGYYICRLSGEEVDYFDDSCHLLDDGTPVIKANIHEAQMYDKYKAMAEEYTGIALDSIGGRK